MNTPANPPLDRGTRNIERARVLDQDARWLLIVYLAGYSPADMEHALDHIEQTAGGSGA